jgi:adenine deaminase
MHSFTVSGQLVDLHKRNIYPAEVFVENGQISRIKEVEDAPEQYILPGFIDAHVHIESSMLVPTSFARMAVVHGTVATISDPHEIANVCGLDGVAYMIENAGKTPFKFFFGAPSCVPATAFETAGATIDAAGINTLLQSPDIWYLAEMMNYPGVLHRDPEIMEKIQAAHHWNKPVDGHAPGLKGDAAIQYAAAGITTDHECFTLDEALGKVAAGMYILIREGSAAKNFEALHPLFITHPGHVMLCSDDKHPDDLVLHHINALVKRALEKGYDLFDVLRAACIHPADHYKVPVGQLRTGDPADFIIVDNLMNFEVLKTFIDGQIVAEQGHSLLPLVPSAPINNFHATQKLPTDFKVPALDTQANIRVIEALEGQLITRESLMPTKLSEGCWVSDPEHDILKITVVNRYAINAEPAVAFIRNFGLQQGAIASTVAHDCHNIIAIGVDDESICQAVNKLIELQGGIVVIRPGQEPISMALPVAGLMTDSDGHEVAQAYAALDTAAKELGCRLSAPFMTLSFMALLVIPSLKLSDKGLFDGNDFRFTSLEA